MDGRLRGCRWPTVLVMVKGEGVISNTISAGPFFGLGSLAGQSKLVRDTAHCVPIIILYHYTLPDTIYTIPFGTYVNEYNSKSKGI